MRFRILALPATILMLCVVIILTLIATLYGTAGEDPPSVLDQTEPSSGISRLEPAASTSVAAQAPLAGGEDADPKAGSQTQPVLDITDLSQIGASEDRCFPYQIHSVYVPQTGHHVHRPFLPYWEELGQAVLGFPISEPITNGAVTVQYFEQARLEYHPQTGDRDARMLLTALGVWRAARVENVAFRSKPPGSHAVDADTRYFEETGQYLRPPFIDFWREHEGSSVFGPPISGPFHEDGTLVQYFAQARLEWDEAAQRVRITPLGHEYATAERIDTSPVPRRGDVRDDSWELTPEPVRIPTLIYHRLGAPESRYQVSLVTFERQLAWLRESGYTTVTMDQAYAAVYRGAPLPENPILITFDDGWAGQWEAAALLDEYDMRGVFFVMPGKIELTFDQLRDLTRRGHEIGSHSVSHADLTDLSADELWAEVAGSKAELAEIIGREIEYFAYPFGSYDDRVAGVVEAAGYCGAVRATHPDGATWAPEARWDQPRIDIPGEIDLETFVRLVEGS